MAAAERAARHFTVGRKRFAMVDPVDLAAAIAPSGVSPAEMRRVVEHASVAGVLATALAPFLAEPPPRHELAAAISAEGIMHVRRRVARLYTEARCASQTKDEVHG